MRLYKMSDVTESDKERLVERNVTGIQEPGVLTVFSQYILAVFYVWKGTLQYCLPG